MPRQYPYVGPDHLRDYAEAGVPRNRLIATSSLESLHRALELGKVTLGPLTLTYVVDVERTVWVADRHSEHIACARGGEVLAAGELTVQDGDAGIEVLEATNQSTGYCPEPDCWHVLAEVLDAAGIRRPDSLTYSFHFRRCLKCGAKALVKERNFRCDECGAPLSETWNLHGAAV